jgi:hypothetical protein
VKNLLLGLVLVSSTAFGATIDDANNLWAARGEDFNNAAKAADIYASLAKTATSETEKNEMLFKETEAVYFVGGRISGKTNKLNTYARSYTVANKLIATVTDKAELSTALYWYAAAMGKWGETKGIFSSLGRWKKEMKPALERAFTLDKTVKNWGINRVYGKAIMKVPGTFGGDKNEGFRLIKEAFDNTSKTMEIDGEEVVLSGQITNNIFLLEGAMILDETDTFCEIFEAAELLNDNLEDVSSEFNPDSMPETKFELEKFFNNDDNVDYYDENC